ncbi:ATPase central domain-containing protein [Actinoplanes sp. SE50]|uniref:ATP-binding protein n=1 Tax=unclassified Actinoplanes TaxID=2626549 RepID=UPI00023EC910|nr:MULTISPECIES: AAA family ATPase [unclassified Actinoplanes]AEV83122.1 ATPase central domain-containing protein [Actinoplanes sp. SE50/110]ATO81517.1 ATPase central domain-containing protein [Actinoplanes sp. SE50]SLL98924.1 ATPase central domain-containing protein [Actinoplanes sp. SE50/110]
MDDAPAWEVLADTLLQREALICRIAEGRPPHDSAGLYPGRDDDLDRVLGGLPGLDGPGSAAADSVREHLAPELERARKLFTEAVDAGRDVFALVVHRAGLTLAEAQVLAVLCAVDLSPARMRLVTYVQNDIRLPRPTLATLARMTGDAGSLSPDARLHTTGLVETPRDGPWARRCPVPADRLLWSLRGIGDPDPDLPHGARLIGRTAATRPTAPVLLLAAGRDAETRTRAVIDRCPGRGLLITAPPQTDAAWCAVVREATLGDRVVVLDLPGEPGPRAGHEILRAAHLSWALTSAVDLPLAALPRALWEDLPAADPHADAGDWSAAFGTAPGGRLTRDQLGLVVAAAGGNPARLPQAVRRLAGGHLDHLTTRLRPRRRWSDLVLPDRQAARLREVITRYRRRAVVYDGWGFAAVPSTGVVALFSGPSGTGKTLAAEVVAAELGLDLYRVDLATVVSKYIGETERNLERVFDAAAAGELVLFFDEADALFGRRSEVTDARDRYANIEVAYLLQRLENQDGIVILATNLHRNIDDAFLRRISVHLDFEPPDEAARQRIWELAFPSGAPADDLDLPFLAAQFRVTGGTIRNAALGAAFEAAENGTTITMGHVVRALRREFDKMGRLCTEADFGRYYALIDLT